MSSFSVIVTPFWLAQRSLISSSPERLMSVSYTHLTLIFIAKKAHPHFIKVFDEYDNLNNSVQENVNASRRCV